MQDTCPQGPLSVPAQALLWCVVFQICDILKSYLFFIRINIFECVAKCLNEVPIFYFNCYGKSAVGSENFQILNMYILTFFITHFFRKKRTFSEKINVYFRKHHACMENSEKKVILWKKSFLKKSYVRHRHSSFKGHNGIVNIVVLNCRKCNQCLKCQVSGHKSLGLLFEGVL